MAAFILACIVTVAAILAFIFVPYFTQSVEPTRKELRVTKLVRSICIVSVAAAFGLYAWGRNQERSGQERRNPGR